MASTSTEHDIIRERELFKYFQPLVDGGDTTKASYRQFLDGAVEEALINKAIESPDRTLTALAQLCACRLDASRAMISVIGKEMQHFIAEATRTVQLSDTRVSEDVNDGLWVGCTTVNKEGRLCEKTIELSPTNGRYPCFQVTDLRTDERFNNLPFVTGPPNFRFYAGTCLTTKRGINIGSLFIIDDRVRPKLTASQIDFLGTVAGIVMRNLELNHEAEERDRSLRMSGALNAFQESRSIIHNPNLKKRTSFDNGDLTSKKRRAKADSIDILVGSVSMGPDGSYGYRDINPLSSNVITPRSSKPSEPASETGDPGFDQPNDIPQQDGDQTPASSFVRAASLLRQSLDLQDTGGVVFLDSRIGFNGQEAEKYLSSIAEDNQSVSSLDTISTAYNGSGHRVTSRKHKHALDVIGFSTAECELGSQVDMGKVGSFSPVDPATLQSFFDHYPRGKLWCFDEGGVLSAWDEDSYDGDPRVSSRETAFMRHQRKQTEATLLSRCFPNVRQLLFAPVWDSSAGRWFSGCFCFSSSPRQIFSVEVELSFLSTFCNTVMAESNRIAFMAAERQKGDFIGSISHELRSPLHGILASAEFLAETEADPFQNSLVDTITSCGRTLLDTVNHILDYSKINSFERNWLNAKKSRAHKSTFAIQGKAAVAQFPDKEAPPMMNIFATVDVAAVAEEVIEGIYAGQLWQDISSTDIAFMSSETKSKISKLGTAPDRRGLGEPGKRSIVKDVEVILDISQDDFHYTTQPGALRRIIMNLFGNSLKYTEKGIIVVSLALRDIDDNDGVRPDEKMLEITVKDTGKGISSEYLKSSVFTPFSQEDTLATGVGLGLSIVKSIVVTLNGTIDIRSQVGVGTEAYVSIPLMRLPGTGTATAESTPSTVASSGSMTTCVQNLQNEYCGKHAVLFCGEDENNLSRMSRERLRVLHTYLTHWYGLKVASPSDPVDIIVVDEKDLPELQSSPLRQYPAVVLCSASPRMGFQRQRLSVMEFVSKPFGPYKLAKAVFTCFERAKGNIDSELDPELTFPDESPFGSSDADTIIPELGGLNLSSQVSSRTPLTEVQSKNDRKDFPFPDAPTIGDTDTSSNQETDNREHKPEDPIQSRADLVRRDSRRPKLTQRATEPMVYKSTATASAVSKSGEVVTSTPAEATAEIAAPTIATTKETETEKPRSLGPTSAPSLDTDRPPRLLLVDDNKINLRLLETFMKKRKYKFVDSAENGQLAVNAADAIKEGYDIIFMDISMPIMNGFEATRAIREIENTRNAMLESASSEGQKESRALIIALTGLASSRDQTEAFNSGVDLFLTKPVSFKEVGRILDNWEAHGGGEGTGKEPAAAKPPKGGSE